MKRVIKQTTNYLVAMTLFALTPLNFVTQTVTTAEATANKTADSATKHVDDSVSKSEQSLTRGNSDNTPAAVNRNEHADEAKAAANARKQDALIVTEPRALTAPQLKKCEIAERSIATSIDRVKTRGEKQLEVFHTISKRTRAFYESKHYSFDGYDSTKEEASRLYDQALLALTATQNAGDVWNCRSDGPLTQIEEFRNTKLAEVVALDTYKNKVQELITLVKTAAAQEKK
jgi:hypothetical protein